MTGSNKILLFCSDEKTGKYLVDRLQDEGGYSVYRALNKEDGLGALRSNGFSVAIVEYKLEEPDPCAFIREIKKADHLCMIIVFLDEYSESILESLSGAGVCDFFVRPVNMPRLNFMIDSCIRMRNLIGLNNRLLERLKEENAELEKQNSLLMSRVADSSKNLTRLHDDLRATYMRTIKALAQAIDARDHYTHSHSENVSRIAVTMAVEMGMNVKDIDNIREACSLHDLGKIGIGDGILLKPAGLTPEEWEKVKRHPSVGADILQPLTFLGAVVDLVRQHHEHYDGTGYPQGLKGEHILLGARIIHLADAYEAMRSARSYRQIPLTKEAAIEEIKRNSGTQFDPKVIEVFMKIIDRL